MKVECTYLKFPRFRPLDKSAVARQKRDAAVLAAVADGKSAGRRDYVAMERGLRERCPELYRLVVSEVQSTKRRPSWRAVIRAHAAEVKHNLTLPPCPRRQQPRKCTKNNGGY